MKKFRVLFYKAKFGDKKWIDDGISIYTTFWNVLGLAFEPKLAWQVFRRRYSHVEIWLPDEGGFFVKCISTGWIAKHDNDKVIISKEICGQCFTSTMRGDDNGTVIRPASEVLTHPERWDYIEIIEPYDHVYKEAVKWAYQQVHRNQGYNKRTILDFFNPFRRTRKSGKDEKNICSVAVEGFLWKLGMFENWMIWSPVKLWWKLYKQGRKTKSLK